MDLSPDRFLRLCLAAIAFLGVPAFGSTSQQGLLLTHPAETGLELLHDNGRLVSKRWLSAMQRCFACSLAFEAEVVWGLFAGAQLLHCGFCHPAPMHLYVLQGHL